MALVGVVGALVADHRLPGLHARHQPQPLELVEDPVDAGAAHAPPAGAQQILDLGRGQRAGLGS